jgi:hypothetical protein
MGHRLATAFPPPPGVENNNYLLEISDTLYISQVFKVNIHSSQVDQMNLYMMVGKLLLCLLYSHRPPPQPPPKKKKIPYSDSNHNSNSTKLRKSTKY